MSDLVGHPKDRFSHNEAQLDSSHLNKRQKFIGLTEEVIKQTYLSHVMRKPAFCICENKGADQLHGNHAADQAFVFAT